MFERVTDSPGLGLGCVMYSNRALKSTKSTAHPLMIREYDTVHLHNLISYVSLFFLLLRAPGVMKEELNSANMKESISKLTDHSSSKLASQASSILTILGDTS